jgi:hypothetical protein
MMNKPSKPIEPPEYGLTLVERFLDEGARHVRLLAVGQRRAERRLAGRRVDAADRHLIEAQLLSGLRQHRLEQADALHAAGRALRGLGRGVGQHGETAPPHRLGLIRQRHRRAGGAAVALRVVRAVVADRVHVDRGDAAVLGHAEFDARQDAGACAADEVLVLARDAHHHGRVGFLREQRRNRH